MRPRRSLDDGRPAFRGRGLCDRDYVRAQVASTLDDWPRHNQPLDAVLAEWELLRQAGVGIRDAAPRLGMTHGALDRALHRATARGDSRGRHACRGRIPA